MRLVVLCCTASTAAVLYVSVPQNVLCRNTHMHALRGLAFDSTYRRGTHPTSRTWLNHRSTPSSHRTPKAICTSVWCLASRSRCAHVLLIRTIPASGSRCPSHFCSRFVSLDWWLACFVMEGVVPEGSTRLQYTEVFGSQDNNFHYPRNNNDAAGDEGEDRQRRELHGPIRFRVSTRLLP